jgi:hypothetical protein
MDHSLLWKQRWLVRHIRTCYTASSPSFRTVTKICHNSCSTRTALTGMKTRRSDHAQWRVSQVQRPRCTWYQLASSFTPHHNPCCPLTGLRQI